MVLVKCLNKKNKDLGKFIEEYIINRKNISIIILILDIRHDPTSDDKLMYDFLLNNNLPFFIVANKADKIAITKVDSAVKTLQKELNPIGDIPTLPFSSERKIYKDEVWNFIDDFLE